ncbi:hypothetical protein GCM10009603_43410 [Nocardiopsis exhalans]
MGAGRLGARAVRVCGIAVVGSSPSRPEYRAATLGVGLCPEAQCEEHVFAFLAQSSDCSGGVVEGVVHGGVGSGTVDEPDL